MTEAERKRRPCAACGKPVGLATIVCGGDFPDAPICFECYRLDPFEEIPKMIRSRLCTCPTGRADTGFHKGYHRPTCPAVDSKSGARSAPERRRTDVNQPYRERAELPLAPVVPWPSRRRRQWIRFVRAAVPWLIVPALSLPGLEFLLWPRKR